MVFLMVCSKHCKRGRKFCFKQLKVRVYFKICSQVLKVWWKLFSQKRHFKYPNFQNVFFQRSGSKFLFPSVKNFVKSIFAETSVQISKVAKCVCSKIRSKNCSKVLKCLYFRRNVTSFIKTCQMCLFRDYDCFHIQC